MGTSADVVVGAVVQWRALIAVAVTYAAAKRAAAGTVVDASAGVVVELVVQRCSLLRLMLLVV